VQKTITPAICSPKGEVPAAYAGNVVIRMPNYDERMGLYEDLGIEDATDLKSVTLVRHLAKRLPEFLISVDLKRLDDGEEFKSWEALQYDSDMAGVISECCLAMISKVRAGKPAPG
jgi:hypothetical protein